IRTHTLEPGIGTPSPSWGTWSIPAGSSSHPAQLILEFEVAVGRAPAKTPNFVEVASDSSDTVAARAVVLSVAPTPIVDMQVTARSPVVAGTETVYTILLRNSGTAAAGKVFVSVALPSGFIYGGTQQIGGNSVRSTVTDPLNDSLLPSWGTWSIPPAQLGGALGQLSIVFRARVLGDEQPGSYTISVTVTYGFTK